MEIFVSKQTPARRDKRSALDRGRRVASVAAAVALTLVGATAVGEDAARTSDGQPNLQGYWTNATFVPLERPLALGDRAEVTLEEARARFTEPLRDEAEPGTDADVHYNFSDFLLETNQNDAVLDTRTSLITDPPSGRIPAPLAAAAERAKERVAYQRAHGFDGPENRTLAERCIVWSHQGPPIVPVGYNSNLQIYQSPNYFVVVTEMMPDARIVPLDGRPRLPSNVPQWLGDSRGHWEGDTLVIETTNFTGRTQIRGMTPGLLLSEATRVTERFQRADENSIQYEFTVEDPNTWAQPWTASYRMQRIEGPMFEYACQEGNYGMRNTLSGARAADRAAAEAAGKAR
jgi:hypothetical protein